MTVSNNENFTYHYLETGESLTMAISSVSPSSPIQSVTQVTKRSQNGKALDAPDIRALDAEKEAQRRITESERNVNRTEHETQLRLEKISSDFSARQEVEINRKEASLNNIKNKGNEQINTTKHQLDEEVTKLKREGERELKRIKEFYKNEIDSTKSTGDVKLKEMSGKHNLAVTKEVEETKADIKKVKDEHLIQSKTLNERIEQDIQKTQVSSKNYLDNIRENSMAANEKVEKQYRQKFDSLQNQQQVSIARMHESSTKKLHALRDEYATKLDAYSERNQDPFYQMKKFDTDFRETDEAYILAAKVPPHERDRITITVRGNSLVLAGQRQNDEKIESEPGKTQTTSSYQAFSESFPIPYPVESKQLAREYDSGTLYIYLPKKLTYERPKFTAQKVNGLIAIERPDFPKRLPIEPGSQGPNESHAENSIASNQQAQKKDPPLSV